MELSPNNYDFAGWATRSNQLCADGRTILPDAFKHHDGEIVPLIWNHQHNDPFAILGKALLHSVDGDIYAYCSFNDTESGNTAKELVQHGDICSLSICANHLKQTPSKGVMHGTIREVSLVVAGANPKARIESVHLMHSEDSDDFEEEIHIYTEESISLMHSDEKTSDELNHANNTKEDKEMPDKETKDNTNSKTPSGKTVKDVIDTMTEEQKTVLYALVGQALKEGEAMDEEDKKDKKDKNDEKGGNDMKHNLFENDATQSNDVLTHADQEAILNLAKSSSVGSFKAAMEIYAEQNSDTLTHGIDDIETLFPDYKDVNPGAPELIERDQSWVGTVIRKARKSPISRVRTRQADARANELRAKGYNNREQQKKLSGNLKLIMRTTDPQTVYRRDELHRDDVIDITDFDVVAYQRTIMRHNLEEDIALAALVGDGREDTDPDKIHESHIRSIWHDDELYTIHADVNIEAARTELQGTNTNANFGENYIYAEAIITAALYAREKYKGKGTLDFYCTPHLLNVMLLARDLNGRRIYDSKADLAKALNVGEIFTVEQMEGLTRTTDDREPKTKKLLGIFVNMGNYQFGSTKGGEITNFEDFDIDFNKYKYLMETRLSGALTEIYSAIALEEPVAASSVAAG